MIETGSLKKEETGDNCDWPVDTITKKKLGSLHNYVVVVVKVTRIVWVTRIDFRQGVVEQMSWWD